MSAGIWSGIWGKNSAELSNNSHTFSWLNAFFNDELRQGAKCLALQKIEYVISGDSLPRVEASKIAYLGGFGIELDCQAIPNNPSNNNVLVKTVKVRLVRHYLQENIDFKN